MKRSQELTERIKDTLEFDEDFEDIQFQEEQDSLDYLKDRASDVDVRSLNILPNNYSVEKIQRDVDEDDIVYEDIEFKESFVERVGEYKWSKLANSIVERLKSLGSEDILLSGNGRRFLSFQFPKSRSTAVENWYKNELGFDPSKIEVL